MLFSFTTPLLPNANIYIRLYFLYNIFQFIFQISVQILPALFIHTQSHAADTVWVTGSSFYQQKYHLRLQGAYRLPPREEIRQCLA